MEAWLVDAKDIATDSDADELHSQLLHANQAISDFLDDSNKSKVLIVAPKGFGKTFLIKLKRSRLRDRYSRMLPRNTLVDRPAGAPNIPKSGQYAQLRENDTYWKLVWSMAIALVTLKEHRVPLTLPRGQVAELYEDEVQQNPCDLFKVLMGLPINQYYKAVEAYDRKLMPAFRQLHSNIAIFIDNVDEFFDDLVRQNMDDTEATKFYKLCWRQAQIGLALAARELNAINVHVKIYATMRREVFQQSFVGTPLGLQLEGSSVNISYSKTDLHQIIEKNIDVLGLEHLVQPRHGELLTRFFGPGLRTLWHAATGDEEKIEDFWIRHTLRRPRDVATIGGALTKVRPGERTENAVKDAIAKAAGSIVTNYFGEMRPHLRQFDETILFPLIPSNVLTAEQVEEISHRYDELFLASGQLAEELESHVFCNLFRIGLLGFVGLNPNTRHEMQHFRFPGEVPLDSNKILPKAEKYLIHPMLDDLIARSNPGYYQAMNKLNVIGAEQRWNAHRETFFVLICDVVNSGRIEADPNLGPDFRAFLEQVTAAHAKSHRLKLGRVENGDQVMLCDENPFELLQAHGAIAEQLRKSEYEIQLRSGGDAGHLHFLRVENRDRPSGVTLRLAARVEACALPDQIVVTGEFVEAVKQSFGAKRLNAVRAREDDVTARRETSGQFNIAKNGAEEPILKDLYVVGLKKKRPRKT